MTINIADNSPRVSYSVAQGVTQTSFTVSFEFFDNDDLNVYVDGTLKTLTTDYTVTGGDGSTGTVTISVTGASGGSTVVITRDIDLERTTDFPASGAFNIATLNTELDRIIAIAADLDDRAARALQLTDFDVAAGLTLPVVDDRKGRVLGFNAVTGAVEAGPSIADTESLANVSADIALLADIQDGTIATNAITTVSSVNSEVATLGAISTDITTVSGISANVTTVSGISADVTTVAGVSTHVATLGPIATDITTVSSNSSNVTTVATNINAVNTVASNIDNVNTVANDLLEVVSEIETVANDLNEATSEIEVVANNIANVNTVGTISGNVTTVAGISADVTAVAGDASDIGVVASNIASVNAVAPVQIIAGIQTISGISSDVTTVAGISSDVTIVASNISGIADFADTYVVSASAPPSPIEGTLWFDTSSDTMKVYNGSSFQNAGSSVNGTSSRGTFTATSGQTVFTTTGYDSGFIDVFMNGVKLVVGTDVTATNGTTFTLTTGAAAGDIVEYIAYGTFELTSVYTQSQSDARYLQLTGGTLTGDLIVGGNLTISGTTTTVNSTTLDVADLNITVANGAADAAAANGAGLTVDGANATFNYAATGDKWTMNKPLDVTGDITSSGTVSAASASVTGSVTAASFSGDGSGLTGIGFTTNVVTTSSTASANNHYYLNAATVTLTLPASPSVGDEVRISEVAGNTDCVIGRNGSNIMGDASDLTIDTAYLVLSLRYVDATIGWAFS
jgi:hypothetical protein